MSPSSCDALVLDRSWCQLSIAEEWIKMARTVSLDLITRAPTSSWKLAISECADIAALQYAVARSGIDRHHRQSASALRLRRDKEESMRDFSVLSRRDVLRMAGAVGGLAVTGVSNIPAQSAKKIESMAPELDRVIATSEPIRELATGYGGDIGPAEGPVWWAEDRYLLFNDIHTARRMRYTPGQGATVVMEKTNEANGMTRDLQGRLVSAEHLTRRVTRYEPDGSLTVIANSFQGKRLLRPNDVIVKSDGSIYFTDPGGNAAPEQWDVTLSGVYRVSADLGSMSLIIDDMVRPNGLAFSPDESILYVADSRRRHVRAYDMQPNGTIAKDTSRVFVDLNGQEPGVPDGIKVDTAGNLYSGGSGGLYIIDSKGKKLGRIVHGQQATTNVAFGGDDWKTLYFTTRSTLLSVTVKVAGLPVPVKKKST